jgi:hypothetical protein
MKFTVIIAISILLLVASCSSSHQTVSSSIAEPAAQRCAAINAQFTNGTPMSQIEAKLGRPDAMFITTTLSFPPETQNQRVWVYHSGSKDILIFSTGEPTTPLRERGFDGARVVRKEQ